MTSKGDLAAEQPGGGGQLLWCTAFLTMGIILSITSATWGEPHKSVLLQECSRAEIISLPNRKEAQKVGVGGGGFQNTTNRYSPLSNYTAALPGASVCNTSSASHPEQWEIFTSSPRGHGQLGDGASGTSFALFWWVGIRIKHRGNYKGLLLCRTSSHQRSGHGRRPVLVFLFYSIKYTSVSRLLRGWIKDYILGAFLRCCQHHLSATYLETSITLFSETVLVTVGFWHSHILSPPFAVPGEPFPPSSWETSSWV